MSDAAGAGATEPQKPTAEVQPSLVSSRNFTLLLLLVVYISNYADSQSLSVIFSALGLWGAWHYWIAPRTLKEDLARAAAA